MLFIGWSLLGVRAGLLCTCGMRSLSSGLFKFSNTAVTDSSKRPQTGRSANKSGREFHAVFTEEIKRETDGQNTPSDNNNAKKAKTNSTKDDRQKHDHQRNISPPITETKIRTNVALCCLFGAYKLVLCEGSRQIEIADLPRGVNKRMYFNKLKHFVIL